MKEVEKDKIVPLKLLSLENDEGYVEVSLRRAGEERSWDYAKDKLDGEQDIVVRINEVNRGGLLTKVRGIDAFLPVSQLSKENYPNVGGDTDRILVELKKFIGKDLNVRIIDIEQQDKKIILSERADEIKKIQEKLTKYKKGDVIEGEVCGIVDYGAFVKFDKQLEGLIHISELDWQLIEHPSQILSTGEVVKAQIIGIDGDQISLSLKALKKDPWLEVEKKYKKDTVVSGTVTKLNPYGAFVKVSDDIQALVPVSRFASYEEMQKQLTVSEEYSFKVFSLDAPKHRMALELEVEKKKSKSEKADK